MLPFEEARAFVQVLGLKRKEEWQAWSKTADRPSNIPSTPDQTYRDDGWISWPDWLGYRGRYTSKRSEKSKRSERSERGEHHDAPVAEREDPTPMNTP
jgi:hypothetical protein